jgi:hypothetical protein
MNPAKRRFQRELREMPGGILDSVAWIARRFWPLLLAGALGSAVTLCFFAR